jgi:hypothetical protein
MTTQQLQSTFNVFFANNNGKPVEVVDPTNYAQCFDLIVAWLDALGIPRVTGGLLNAYQIYNPSTAGLKQYCDIIPNSILSVPQKGDIVVWGSSYNNGPGHTGVATGNGNIFNFDCFEQNDPLKTYAHVKNYSYKGVLGWLRPKTTEPLPIPQPPMNDINLKAKAQVDKILVALRDAHEIDNAASEFWLNDASDPDKLTGLIKRIERDKQNAGSVAVSDFKVKVIAFLEDCKLKINSL